MCPGMLHMFLNDVVFAVIDSNRNWNAAPAEQAETAMYSVNHAVILFGGMLCVFEIVVFQYEKTLFCQLFTGAVPIFV